MDLMALEFSTAHRGPEAEGDIVPFSCELPIQVVAETKSKLGCWYPALETAVAAR